MTFFDIKQDIAGYVSQRADVVGFAPVERFDEAPDPHHPSMVCKDASTIIVFGIALPKGILQSPGYGLHVLHRSYHTVYPQLDNIALDLAGYIEAQTGSLAVPVPSYAPLKFHGAEPWGLLSLKHAAVKAGLGSLSKGGLFLHSAYGSLLRLSAVVTSEDIPGDPLDTRQLCPDHCRACHKVCPANAFDENGVFDKTKCLNHTIKHAIYPLAFKGRQALAHIERVINTAGNDYWLECNECLKVCPANRSR